MADPLDPLVVAALERDGHARVIVTFDHEPTASDLAPYDVIFVFRSIRAAALRVDRDALDRLLADDCVVSIESDGEVRASD